jgi:hypothetical protein
MPGRAFKDQFLLGAEDSLILIDPVRHAGKAGRPAGPDGFGMLIHGGTGHRGLLASVSGYGRGDLIPLWGRVQAEADTVPVIWQRRG